MREFGLPANNFDVSRIRSQKMPTPLSSEETKRQAQVSEALASLELRTKGVSGSPIMAPMNYSPPSMNAYQAYPSPVGHMFDLNNPLNGHSLGGVRASDCVFF